jgi:hypothetical protein
MLAQCALQPFALHPFARHLKRALAPTHIDTRDPRCKLDTIDEMPVAVKVVAKDPEPDPVPVPVPVHVPLDDLLAAVETAARLEEQRRMVAAVPTVHASAQPCGMHPDCLFSPSAHRRGLPVAVPGSASAPYHLAELAAPVVPTATAFLQGTAPRRESVAGVRSQIAALANAKRSERRLAGLVLPRPSFWKAAWERYQRVPGAPDTVQAWEEAGRPDFVGQYLQEDQFAFIFRLPDDMVFLYRALPDDLIPLCPPEETTFHGITVQFFPVCLAP